MERSSLIRWLLIGAAAFLFWKFGLPALTGKKDGGPAKLQPLAGIVDNTAPRPEGRPAETTCKLKGTRFTAELSSKGGALKHAWLEGERYTFDQDGKRGPIDLVTTWVQSRLPLRTDLREPAGTADQVPYDDLDWKITEQSSKRCAFSYEDDQVKLDKTVVAADQPYALQVGLTVTNKSDQKRQHRLTIEQTDWRTTAQTKGHWGRQSELMTKTEARAGDEMVRKDPGDFEADDFGDEGFTNEKWFRAPGEASFAAVSSSYLSKAIFNLEAPSKPVAEMLIEEVWNSAKFPDKEGDPNHGHVYRARLNYGLTELDGGQSASYRWLAYVGPKERDVLASFGAGKLHASDLLDLGMFGAIGKILIAYLYLLHDLVGTWGFAICLLTITVKLLLFPLSISQIKSTMAMRKLKPQMDELNKKYKDDATQRGIAMQELWRKNNVTNPMLGCLPVLLQMPVWFALYTALLTAVELYHTPFGPFIPDLSKPGLYYIIPILLGGSSFLQQHLMPMQGDAMQQKLMKYMMPAVFTVMMLFLPAGLGIYFLTNTWLSIGQQVGVERYYQTRGQTPDDPKADEQRGADKTKRKAA